MKLGTLAAAAAISLVGVTGASAQVFVAEPYVTGSYIAAGLCGSGAGL